MRQKLVQYIKDNWVNTIRPACESSGTLLKLPKPYTTPCMSGHFQEMYYWDTYFTNVGLLLSGLTEQAKNNVDNMIYMINTYGFMPNGNRTYYLNRSQPPFLSLMVKDVWDVTGDLAWLREEAYPALEKEWAFWQTKRQTALGLNRYAADVFDEAGLTEFAEVLCDRGGLPMPADKETVLEWGRSMFSLAESGWDCTSRFALDGHLYAPADLNSLLYMLEKNLAAFAKQLEKDADAAQWEARAAERRDKMVRLLWSDERQVFADTHVQTGKSNDVVSAAAFYPLFVGLATAAQADKTVAALALLEAEHGVACCENRDDLFSLQWDYPHGWACLHYVVIKGLLNYGKREDALRIARKYVDTATANFAETQNLWEKYDVVTGKVSVTKEYQTPPMMGWSAGIYLYCEQLLREAGM
jgi:alpha,alpha-trehalase